MMMNKEKGDATPPHLADMDVGGGMLVFDGGKGGMLVFQQDLDSSQGVRQSRKGVGTIQCRWKFIKLKSCC